MSTVTPSPVAAVSLSTTARAITPARSSQRYKAQLAGKESVESKHRCTYESAVEAKARYTLGRKRQAQAIGASGIEALAQGATSLTISRPHTLLLSPSR